MDRNIILTIEAPDGRQAYVEKVGEVLVIGGDLPPEQALIELARRDRRATRRTFDEALVVKGRTVP